MTSATALRMLDTIATAFDVVLRLTKATVGRLFTQATKSVETIMLELDELPTLTVLQHVVRVLVDHGLFVLTIPRAMEVAARDLIRQVAGFDPQSARQRQPASFMHKNHKPPKYRAPTDAPRPEPTSPTVDIWVRKAEPRQRIKLAALPKVAMNTPRLGLRYPGSKLKLIDQTIAYLPSSGVIVSPFAGGLNVEVAAAKRGCTIMASDRNADLINMWAIVKEQRGEFERAAIALLAEMQNSTDRRSLYYFWRDVRFHWLTDRVERAAMFFALHRMSAFGTRIGGFAHGDRFTEKAIRLIAAVDLARISFVTADFRDAIDRASATDFLYLDPPYLGFGNMYGGSAWRANDYLDLLDPLKDRGRWLLHMNDCGDVRALFDGFPMISIEVRNATNHAINSELIILPRDTS
jgi:site-specific DNA-adenine methylase